MRRSAKGRYIRQKKSRGRETRKDPEFAVRRRKAFVGGNSDVIGGKPARIFGRAARDGRANGGLSS